MSTAHLTLRGVALLAAALLATSSLPTSAAPKADLWERWTAHDPTSEAAISHRDWDRFLATYLREGDDGVNRIDYGGVRPADRASLNAYIESLTGLTIGDYRRDEQLAYWINLYNALTVKVVLDHYPVKSILDVAISPGLFSFGPWDKKLIEVEGEALSLNDIEHRILRPIWRDPRVHYAVNCASVGCPHLRREAFTAEHLGRRLDAAARDYINSPRGAKVDARRQLFVSSIYEWFKEDFGDSDRGVIAHLREYADPELTSALEGIERITDDYYSWELNDLRRPARSGDGRPDPRSR